MTKFSDCRTLIYNDNVSLSFSPCNKKDAGNKKRKDSIFPEIRDTDLPRLAFMTISYSNQNNYYVVKHHETLRLN